MIDPGWLYQAWRTLSANAQLVSAEATPVRPDGHSLKSSTTPGARTGGGGGGGSRGAGGGGAAGEGRLSSAKANAPGGVSHSTFSSSAVTSTGTSCSVSSDVFTVAMPLYSFDVLVEAGADHDHRESRRVPTWGASASSRDAFVVGEMLQQVTGMGVQFVSAPVEFASVIRHRSLPAVSKGTAADSSNLESMADSFRAVSKEI
ncbi:hypothetical protein SAMN04488581_4446 [Mycolicibacterium neoaurum]|nr:hypothetical protein SAMN04488581_4446 [Mycolicibacterium neoaurum]